MNNNRFANLFGLSEAQAIALLDQPQDQIGEDDSRYVAASQLVCVAPPFILYTKVKGAFPLAPVKVMVGAVAS